MLGVAVERTPKIEQVNLTGGRLIREAKVCFLNKLSVIMLNLLFVGRIKNEEMVQKVLFIEFNKVNLAILS